RKICSKGPRFQYNVGHVVVTESSATLGSVVAFSLTTTHHGNQKEKQQKVIRGTAEASSFVPHNNKCKVKWHLYLDRATTSPTHLTPQRYQFILLLLPHFGRQHIHLAL
ncbi:unnamed protein product, partial [Linum tenue]